jgi:outer membrane protein TolC
MQKHHVSIVTLLISFLASAVVSDSARAETLTIDAFLDQVRKSNTGYQGATTSGDGGQKRSKEAGLITSPSLFANVQLTGDSKLTASPFGSFDRANTNDYQFGLAETTPFGLKARLYYDATYSSVTNLNYPGTPPFSYSLYDARPVLELTQSLWSNGFGRSTRAQTQFTEAQALQSSYSARYQAKTILTNAEAAYWQLSISRQLVALEQDAEERAQQIYDYSVRRAKLHLTDQADALQALASLEARKLDVQTAKDNERVSARAFNAARNVSSDEVSEVLTETTHSIADRVQAPARAKFRDDVKAAEQGARATQANAIVQSDKDLPTLEIFGSAALNGRSDTFGPSVTNAFNSGRNTLIGGVRLSVPLALGTTSTSREGWAKEKAAAELTYEKALFDQEQTWQDLNLRLNEAKKRLSMARSIEQAQKRKLDYEKDRLKKGRTTTYQVLLFEQDYLLAEASRVNAEGDVFTIYTQMKLDLE